MAAQGGWCKSGVKEIQTAIHIRILEASVKKKFTAHISFTVIKGAHAQSFKRCKLQLTDIQYQVIKTVIGRQYIVLTAQLKIVSETGQSDIGRVFVPDGIVND